MVIEPIKVIKVDGEEFAIADASDTVKNLVAFYDDWRQVEMDERSSLLRTQAGLRDISREIVAALRKDNEPVVEGEDAGAVIADAEEVLADGVEAVDGATDAS